MQCSRRGFQVKLATIDIRRNIDRMYNRNKLMLLSCQQRWLWYCEYIHLIPTLFQLISLNDRKQRVRNLLLLLLLLFYNCIIYITHSLKNYYNSLNNNNNNLLYYILVRSHVKSSCTDKKKQYEYIITVLQ